MKIVKLPLKKKYCKKCKKELKDDWMYNECKECMLGKQKLSKIVTGAVVGGLVLGIATAVYKLTSKGND